MKLKPIAPGLLALSLAFPATPSLAEPLDDAAQRIVEAAKTDSRAYDKLTDLCDRVGHRLSGSHALDRAIEWAVAEFHKDGIDEVRTEPVMVPRWIRGEERSRIVEPVVNELATIALGGTVATPKGGLVAEVVEVSSFEELEGLGDSVAGKIVLYNKEIFPNGGRERGYGSASGLRVRGPSRAAKQGAVGTLVRSLGTANYRLPHTGAMRYTDDDPKVPAVAIAAEDAEQIHRLLASGDTVRVEMVVGGKTMPDVESANVIAEIRGRELPDEVVVIAAHLDSWDVGHGAHDDGAGCVTVMETLRLLKKLGLTPRRTIRAVLYTNEENGLRGGRAYAKNRVDVMGQHVAAIESDSGGGRPLGFGVTAGEGGIELMQQLSGRLAAIEAGEITAGGGGADISPMKKHGVPQISIRPDTVKYFDYHHTAADTLDKVSKEDLDLAVAAMTVMAYSLAEVDWTLPRIVVEAE